MELRYGGRSTAPTNRFQLVEHWNWRRDIDDPRAYDHNNKVQVANRHTLTDRVRIPATGGIVSGYLVFVANLPRTGTADLFIPLQSESGRGLQTFEVSYQF